MPSITAIAGVSLSTLLLASSITATIFYYKTKALQAQLDHASLEVSQLTTSNSMLSYKITQQNEEIAKLHISRQNTFTLAKHADDKFTSLLANSQKERQIRNIDELFRVFEGALDAAH